VPEQSVLRGPAHYVCGVLRGSGCAVVAGMVYNFGLAESDPLHESAELLLTILAMAHERWDSYVRDGKALEAAVIDRFVTSVRCRFDPVAPFPYDD
jgi:hypothetical protein